MCKVLNEDNTDYADVDDADADANDAWKDVDDADTHDGSDDKDGDEDKAIRMGLRIVHCRYYKFSRNTDTNGHFGPVIGSHARRCNRHTQSLAPFRYPCGVLRSRARVAIPTRIVDTNVSSFASSGP